MYVELMDEQGVWHWQDHGMWLKVFQFHIKQNALEASLKNKRQICTLSSHSILDKERDRQTENTRKLINKQ